MCFSASSSHHVTCAMMSRTDHLPVTFGVISCSVDEPRVGLLEILPRAAQFLEHLLRVHCHFSGVTTLQEYASDRVACTHALDAARCATAPARSIGRACCAF